MAERRGPVIRLQDGPGAGWQFYEEDFLERIRAAQRMGRTVPDASGWALGYERPVSGVIRIRARDISAEMAFEMGHCVIGPPRAVRTQQLGQTR